MESYPPNSWLPQDIFDEESCRFMLREVGELIVPFYPFVMGIHEVYGMLLDRYGKDFVADPLSVLQELLEGEDNANGLGDDGDIWRSWRHSWRYRNNDPHKSSIPEARGIILPPPSPYHVRVARAKNFLAWSAATDWGWSENEIDELPNQENQTLPACSMSPEDLYRTTNNRDVEAQPTTLDLFHSRPLSQQDLGAAVDELLARQSPDTRAESENRLLRALEDCKLIEQGSLANYQSREESLDINSGAINTTRTAERGQLSDSEQEFDEVKEWADSIDFDQPELVRFDMLQPTHYSHHDSTNPTDTRVRTLRAVQAPDNDEHQRPSLSQNPNIRVQGKIESRRGEKFDEWNPSLSPVLLPRSPRTDMGGQSSQSQRPMKRRTSTNREARLIDGAIFTSRLRDLVEPRVHDERDITSKPESKRSSLRASWSGSRQKENLRHSLYQGVRSVFRHQNKQSPTKVRTQDSNKDNVSENPCEMSSPHRSGVSENSKLPGSQNRRNYGLRLDGAFDEVPYEPRSPINLNKALPQAPRIPCISTPSSAHTRIPSFDHSQATTERPSTASTVSSGISTSSSKRDFRSLARALVGEEMAVRRPNLSPVRETEVMLDPPKQDQISEMSAKSEYSDFSFRSIMNSNPFANDPVPLTPKMPLPLSLRKRESPKMSKSQGIPQSRSEPNFQPSTMRKAVVATPLHPPLVPTCIENGLQRNEKTPKTAECPIPPHLTRQDPQKEEDREVASSRGRTPHRPKSPNHTFKKLNAESKPTSPEKLPKRSRSPVKKFLGFVKSSSMKELASETPPRSNNTSPDKSKMKTWGNRLRHGFLTTDSDSEHEHEPIASPEESHATFSSPPQQSTFPISIAPPEQAAVLSQMELMICVSGNNFLMHEFYAGRLSESSVARVKEQWKKKNRPQVLEFFYDQATQRELILTNLNSVHLHGESAKNALVLNATMYAWKTMATEMTVRTFCTPDSALRKYMHDAHKILETLGASLTTFLAFQDLQVATLMKMNNKQRERSERARNVEEQTSTRRGKVGTPAPIFGHTPKSSKGTIESSPSPGFKEAYEAYENSRGGRLGMMVREIAEGRAPL